MQLELAVLDWIQLHLRCELLDWLMPFVSGLSNHGEIWILFAALLLLIRRQRVYGRWGIESWPLRRLCPNPGPDCLQHHFKAPHRPSPALCVPPGYFPAGFPARGRIFPLRSHSGSFCHGLCLENRRKSPVVARSGPGHRHGFFPALSLCSLAHRCLGRCPARSRRGLGRSKAGEGPSQKTNTGLKEAPDPVGPGAVSMSLVKKYRHGSHPVAVAPA